MFGFAPNILCRSVVNAAGLAAPIQSRHNLECNHLGNYPERRHERVPMVAVRAANATMGRLCVSTTDAPHPVAAAEDRPELKPFASRS